MMAQPTLDQVFEKLVNRLESVRARQQAAYKTQLALALAALVPCPKGGDAVLYANRSKFDPPDLEGWRHVGQECMLDLAFLHRPSTGAAWSTLATAESEAYPNHLPGLTNGDDQFDLGYFWDLFKVLQYPSPLRVFMAVTNPRSFDILPGNLVKYAKLYGEVARSGDRLFLVTVSDTNAGASWLHLTELKAQGAYIEVGSRIGP
jgi:hypothetical protein